MQGGIDLTLGKKIKAFRTRAELSQEQLADKLCVSRQAITKWENDRGIPDINNLQCIANLFDVSIDSLVNSSGDITTIVIKEDIDIEKYQKNGKFRSKYDTVVKEKYPNAITIYPLIRRKKLNLAQEIVDFFVQPGVLQVADSFNDMSSYYLVELNGRQLLVRITKTFIEGRELNFKFDGKKCIIDGNIFKKANYTI
jgi:transcriptional regulator with XRE-family HTH domain